jgi:CheY-like chemotaxis protein
MNLILNASDSLEGEAGSVEVRVRSMQVSRDLLRRGFVGRDLPAGLYVTLEVSDSGCGMDSETLSRIFDPFFTTKFTGRGLGLASSLGIVRSHHGAILVESRKEKGTTFQLLFPALEETGMQEEPGEEVDALPSPPVTTGQRGTVLIVDDEAAVRRLAASSLERAGFDVMLAADGKEGVGAFLENAEDIDAILLDLTMPGMDGREVLDEIRKVSEEIPVVLSSGFSEDQALQGLVDSSHTTFLRKPYAPCSLQQMMTRLTGLGTGCTSDDPPGRRLSIA